MPIGVTMLKSIAPYYSAIFGRGGAYGTFTIEVMNEEGTCTLDVDVQHKNEADTNWATVISFTQFTGVSIQSVSVGGIMEQVRFKYTVGGAAASDFVHVFVFAPVWRD